MTRGAYGLRLRGLRTADHLLVDIDDKLPTCDVHTRARRSGAPAPPPEFEDDDGACVHLVDGGLLTATRSPLKVTFETPHVLDDAEVLHPYLAAAIGPLSRWLSRTCLHGAVIGEDGDAVLLLGDREAGKSTLAAYIATRGGPLAVLSDDVAVINGTDVYAGPSCIDLRPAAAAALGLDHPSRLARGDSRYRFDLLPRRSVARLVGALVLEWGPAPLLTEVGVAQRLPNLLPHCAVSSPERDAERLLALAELPVWRLSRPRDWLLMDRSAELVRAALTEGARRC